MRTWSDNRLARFSSPDPLAGSRANPQSVNRYAYVGNNPTSLTDPSGLVPRLYKPAPSDGGIDWGCITATGGNSAFFDLCMQGGTGDGFFSDGGGGDGGGIGDIGGVFQELPPFGLPPWLTSSGIDWT